MHARAYYNAISAIVYNLTGYFIKFFLLSCQWYIAIFANVIQVIHVTFCFDCSSYFPWYRMNLFVKTKSIYHIVLVITILTYVLLCKIIEYYLHELLFFLKRYQQTNMADGMCAKCSRYLLVVFNFFFWVRNISFEWLMEWVKSSLI